MKRKRGRPRKPGPREPSGRPSRMPPERRDEIMRQALDARARQTGVTDRKALAAPWMGCRVGRSIAGESDVAALWEAVCAVRKAHKAFLAAIEAPPINGRPTGISVALSDTPEEAIDRPPVDLRSHEERCLSAIAAWDDFCATLRAVDPCLPQYVVRTVVQDEPQRDLARVLRWIAEGNG